MSRRLKISTLIIILFALSPHEVSAVIKPVKPKQSTFLQKQQNKKITLKERIVLSLVQRKIKRQKQAQNIKDIFDNPAEKFNVWAFLLGLILNILGVIIVLFFLKKGKESVVIGFICSTIIFLGILNYIYAFLPAIWNIIRASLSWTL